MVQLLLPFMPYKTETELIKAQVENYIKTKLEAYSKKHLEDDAWFRKKWITDDIKRRYMY